MNLKDVFQIMIENNVSDCFLRAGSPVRVRICTEVKVINDHEFSVEEIEDMVLEMLDENKRLALKNKRGYELTLWYGDQWRFRIGIFYQRNTLAMVIRAINLSVPNFQELNLPTNVMERFALERRGLILLTGVTGSGKSTAIASLIEYMNQNLGRHILTIEEPIEFTFKDKKSMINQREIGKDVASYEDALKQFALHSPDIIYIGNIRDAETCRAALTAAETGVLVLSTLHTINASSTVERIVNFFPPHQHHLVLTQLSILLKGVLSLRLIPAVDKDKLIPAYEAMLLSPTISRLLRENKMWEIPKYIASGDIYHMKSFNQCLTELIEAKSIDPKIALEYSDKPEELEMQLKNKALM